MSQIIENTEVQVIAKLYANPKSYFEFSSKLTEKIFTDSKIKMFFRAFETLLRDSKKTDSYSICKHLNRIDLIDDLVAIAQKVNYNDTLESLIDYLHEQQKRNGFGTLIIELNDMLKSGNEIESIISHAQSSIISISDVKTNSIKHISEYMKEMLENIERNKTAKGITGIPTGILDFDTFSGGLQKSDLFVLAGATSQGKTSFALTILNNVAKSNVPCAIFSLEMSSLQLAARLSSQESEIDSKHILRGRLSDYEIERVNSKISKLSFSPLYIDESGNTSLNNIVNSIHALKMTLNVEVIVIDYLQLVSNSQKGRSKEQEVAEIARTLKNLAKELDICIILLSQLNRGKDARGGDFKPRLSDLRDSGQIEEAADIVAFVYRPEYYGIEQDESGNSTIGTAELIIAKGRNIGIGTIDILFDKHLTRFRGKESVTFESKLSALQPSSNFNNHDQF